MFYSYINYNTICALLSPCGVQFDGETGIINFYGTEIQLNGVTILVP